MGAAGLFGQRGVDGLTDAVDIEHGAVGKAPGKADDAGLAQQLEQFTDGGGFYVVEAVGKWQGHGRSRGGNGLPRMLTPQALHGGPRLVVLVRFT